MQFIGGVYVGCGFFNIVSMFFQIYYTDYSLCIFLENNYDKIENEHHLKGTLWKQSNKHQNSQKTLLNADKKKL